MKTLGRIALKKQTIRTLAPNQLGRALGGLSDPPSRDPGEPSSAGGEPATYGGEPTHGPGPASSVAGPSH
jgi:hypothetical protein